MNNRIHNRQTLTVQNNISDCEKLHSFLTGFIQSNDIPDDTYHDLRLVVEEIFINIISHGYTDNETDTVTIELDQAPGMIRITFTDAGIEFNPLKDCSETGKTADFCEGGMGLQIIKSLTDSQKYLRIRQHNVFTLTKLYTKKKEKFE